MRFAMPTKEIRGGEGYSPPGQAVIMATSIWRPAELRVEEAPVSLMRRGSSHVLAEPSVRTENGLAVVARGPEELLKRALGTVLDGSYLKPASWLARRLELANGGAGFSVALVMGDDARWGRSQTFGVWQRLSPTSSLAWRLLMSTSIPELAVTMAEALAPTVGHYPKRAAWEWEVSTTSSLPRRRVSGIELAPVPSRLETLTDDMAADPFLLFRRVRRGE